MALDKEVLFDLLKRKAFDPIMRAKPDGRSETDKAKLEHVRKATAADIDRYRGYRSARELLTNFRRDLSSSAAKKIHSELRHLGLPTIADIRDEFDEKARELGVEAGR